MKLMPKYYMFIQFVQVVRAKQCQTLVFERSLIGVPALPACPAKEQVNNYPVCEGHGR